MFNALIKKKNIFDYIFNDFVHNKTNRQSLINFYIITCDWLYISLQEHVILWLLQTPKWSTNDQITLFPITSFKVHEKYPKIYISTWKWSLFLWDSLPSHLLFHVQIYIWTMYRIENMWPNVEKGLKKKGVDLHRDIKMLL